MTRMAAILATGCSTGIGAVDADVSRDAAAMACDQSSAAGRDPRRASNAARQAMSPNFAQTEPAEAGAGILAAAHR